MRDFPCRNMRTRQDFFHVIGISRLVFGLCVATTAGCSSLTSVDAPDVVQPGDAGSPAGANALRIGAITTFYTWLGSSPSASLPTENMVNYAGLLSDELFSGEQATANTSPSIDARRLSDPS